MYGAHNGQLRAIDEWNASQDTVRIHRNQNLIRQNYLPYRFQICNAHPFGHPDHGTDIGEGRQEAIEDLLKLRA